jgi:hypothetical protein
MNGLISHEKLEKTLTMPSKWPSTPPDKKRTGTLINISLAPQTRIAFSAVFQLFGDGGEHRGICVS